jgi:hypothetical protein
MKITTLAGAVVLSAALAAPALAEAGDYYRARPYGAYYAAPYRVHRYGYYAPYGYYAYPHRYHYYRRAYVPPRPYYGYGYGRPRFRFGIWW